MSLWDQVTDVQRDAIVTRLIGALPTSGVPEHLRPGLVRYFSDGVLPGGFLRAVLVGDTPAAFHRADPESLHALPDLLIFLKTYAPAIAWGSREKVLAWTTTPERWEG